MKKLSFLVVAAGILAFSSCGPNAEQIEKMKQDSIRKADSIKQDSAVKSQKVADSLAAIEAKKADDAKRIADSLHQDSITKKLIKVKK